MSGLAMDDVKVHYNSNKPAELNAHAFAQGTDIFLAPGQEKQLPHEAWHVAQQKQGRVNPTKQLKGKTTINDDQALENEADVMGAKAQSLGLAATESQQAVNQAPAQAAGNTAQLSIVSDLTLQTLTTFLSAHSLQSLLTFADVSALNKLKSFDSFNSIYGSVEKYSNALTLAINIWDSIPAPVRTGILFITGKLMANIPFVDVLKYTEGYLVDADKDVKSTYLVYAVDKLKVILKAASSPVSSAMDFGKYIYTSWWSSNDDSGNETDKDTKGTVSEKKRKDDIAKLDLKIIWLNVKDLHLEKSKEATDTSEKQEGGLHADFALGVNLFNHKKTLGQNGSLTLVLPFSGGAILESKETIEILNSQNVLNLFEVDKLDMKEIKVSNEGLQTLKFHLKKLSIGQDNFTVGKADAAYQASSGLTFDGDIGMKIYEWAASGKAALQLDKEGNFESGSISGFKETSGLLTVDKTSLSKDKGFEIENAKAKLPESANLDLQATIDRLAIKKDSVIGKGSLEAQNVNLLGDKVVLDKASGTLNFHNKDKWDIAATAGLKMNFDQVNASGTFDISYDSKSKHTTLKLSDGQFNVDYDAFSVKAQSITYDHDAREFKVPTATMNIKAIDTEGTVKDFKVNREGVDFKSAKISHSAPIKPFEALTIENLNFLLEKDGKNYKPSAEADLNVKSDSPSVTGSAKKAKIGFSKEQFKGEVDDIQLNTNPFSLQLKKAEVSKAGLSVAAAKLSLNAKSTKEQDKEAGGMITGFNTGLLDFLDVGPVSFEAKGINLSKSGLKVESFKPNVPPVGFDAFGVSGHLDVANMKGDIGAKYQVSLEKIAAGLPLKASVIFPVFPGLEVYGSLGADATLGADFKVIGEGHPDFWEISGHAGFNGAIMVTAELGAQAGSQLIAALSAGVFAKGTADLKASAKIKGKTKYDKAEKKFKTVEPLMVAYNMNAEAIASIGVVIKAKALYFFEKKIYEYTAAEWKIGKYEMIGKLGDNEGNLSPEKAEKMGLDKKRANDIEVKELAGEEANQVLKSDKKVVGSGEARQTLLQTEKDRLSETLSKLHKNRLSESTKIKKIESKYISTISKKDALFQQTMLNLSDVEANKKLEEFNTKYKVQEILEQYSSHISQLEKIEEELKDNQEKLVSLVSKSLRELENGIKDQVETASSVEEDLSKISVPDGEELIGGIHSMSDGLDNLSEKMNLTIDSLNSVMSYEDFVKNTTTKEFFMETKRKSILPVDNALKAYHESKSKTKLELLLNAIDTYLANSKSGRVPYVLALQLQVKKALSAMS